MALSSLTGALLGPLLSSKLMGLGLLWTSLLISIVAIPLATSLIVFIPETLQVKSFIDEDGSSRKRSPISSAKMHLKHAISQFAESVSMLKSPSLVLTLLTYIIQYPVVIGMTQFFSQYVSKRFGWTLANTGYLLSIRGVANIIVLLLILPGLSKLLLSPALPFRLSAPRKDLTLARLSTLALALGLLLLAGPDIVAVAAGTVVVTLGAGLGPSCRALITTFVDAQHTSRLYTLIGIVEVVGAMYSGPGLAWFFTIGMQLGGLWLGLPYLWLAALCALAGLALCFVTVGKTVEKVAETEGEGEVEGAVLQRRE
jgi:hypothetical protein